ncbi:MAG: TlpA family protein disulfide reductase [Candidatus Paceibacterota bacterium]
MIDTKKYIFTLVLTSAIFATAFFASSFFSEKRVENVKEIQDNIAIDILSSETQFDLLKEVSCSNVSDSMLSPQLSEIGDKLSQTESDRGTNDPDVVYLKKYYTLLEVKDFLLSKQFVAKCGQTKKPVSIIYFYSNAGDCAECEREGYVLTRLKEKYPDLRVYSFDYNLDLSAVDSMKRIYKITSSLPALVIEEKTYIGFKSVEDLEALLPATLKAASTAQSTTTATTSKAVK